MASGPLMLVVEDPSAGVTRAIGPYSPTELRSCIDAFISGLEHAQEINLALEDFFESERSSLTFSVNARCQWTIVEQAELTITTPPRAFNTPSERAARHRRSSGTVAQISRIPRVPTRKEGFAAQSLRRIARGG